MKRHIELLLTRTMLDRITPDTDNQVFYVVRRKDSKDESYKGFEALSAVETLIRDVPSELDRYYLQIDYIHYTKFSYNRKGTLDKLCDGASMRVLDLKEFFRLVL